MMALAQTSISPVLDTVEKCQECITDLRMKLTFAEAEATRLRAELAEARAFAGRELARSTAALLLVEEQVSAVDAAKLEHRRIVEAMHATNLRYETVASRLNDIERGARYVDRMLATQTSAEEHLGAVYGFGSQVMRMCHVPAPPHPRLLLFQVFQEDVAEARDDESGTSGDDEHVSTTAATTLQEGGEYEAHARECYHEARHGIVTAAAGAGLHHVRARSEHDEREKT